MKKMILALAVLCSCQMYGVNSTDSTFLKEETAMFLDHCRLKGVTIIKPTVFDVSEYTDGTGVTFMVYNPTKKTIKYVWISIKGFNAVGDPVYRTGQSVVKLTAVGPIAAGSVSSFEYKYVWRTDLVESAKIVSVRVQYMDGTFKLIQPGESVCMTNEEYRYLQNQGMF